MNEEMKEGLKLLSKGARKGVKTALLKFKGAVDNFVDTVTDDGFEEKVKAETQAMVDNFNKELKEVRDKLEKMSEEAAKEYKEEVDETKEKIKDAIDDVAEEIKKEADK